MPGAEGDRTGNPNGAHRVQVVRVAEDPSNEEFWTYVVRATFPSGRNKSKNVLVAEDHDLYVKNRAVPWSEGKQWTYLEPAQLKRRSRIAGLGSIIDLPDSEGGLGLLLEITYQPLITDSEVAEELLLTLAKTLLIFPSPTNPAS